MSLASAGTGNTATISLASNLAPGTYLSGAVGGQFDVSSVLPGNAITSALLVFSIQDDTEGYSYTGQSGAYYYYSDPFEGVTLSAGNQSVSGQTQYVGHSTPYTYSFISGYGTYAYSCGFSVCYGSYPIYSTGYGAYVYSGYSGSFSLSLALNTFGIASLMSGTLPFTLTTSGDARLTEASMELDLRPVRAESVPDSGSGVTLMAVGFLAMVILRSLSATTRLSRVGSRITES